MFSALVQVSSLFLLDVDEEESEEFLEELFSEELSEEV